MTNEANRRWLVLKPIAKPGVLLHKGVTLTCMLAPIFWRYEDALAWADGDETLIQEAVGS